MKTYKFAFALIVTALFSLNITAQNASTQEDEKLSLNSGTLDNQFEYVIRRSNNYQEYKVVKKTWLYSLKSHTLDSLKVLHNNLNDTKIVVNTQAEEIASLKTNLTNTQGTLDKTNIEKDNMSLFGMQMSKSSYNTMLWSIIAGLLAFLLFFIYKYKNSNAITKEAKTALSETEEEFEEHRRKALEREQKVRRQLQDELNKNKSNG